MTLLLRPQHRLAFETHKTYKGSEGVMDKLGLLS